MKRLLATLSALAALTFCALPAPAAEPIAVVDGITVSADYDWTRFAGQNVTLNVYNWGEYISNGSDDSIDVVDAFEKLTGISVNYTTFDSNESMYAKLKSGAASYDVIIPSDYMVAKMIDEEMLLPLNYENIPNFALIDEEYRNPDYDPANAYTVPYMLCTTGIIYNTTMVSEAPTAWADLWDEQYAGSILMFNNSRDAYAIAAFKEGRSVNPPTTDEVDEVMEQLKAQKPLVQAYVMDEIFDKMIGGEAAVGVYYSGDAITMIDDNPDLAWVFPEEGSVLSVDCMCIPAASHQLHVRGGRGRRQRRVHRLHHPQLRRLGTAGRGAEVQRDRLPLGRDRRQRAGLYRPERGSEQRAGRQVERDEELRRGRQRLFVPAFAAGHGPAGLLQHLAQDAQKNAQYVLTRKREKENTMEDHSTYTEQITLDEGDVDYRGLMRPSALLRCAEHMATAHAWGLGMDKAFYSARQMVYLVGRQAFQFYRAPAMRETVTLTTYPEKTRRGANKRVLVVRSLDGEELARVDTRWTLVDTCAGKIIRHIPPEIDQYWSDTVDWELSLQVPKAAELVSAGSRRAAYSICDTNRHINNASYLDVACDALPLEVIDQGPVRFAAIKYHRQVPLGEEMELFYGQAAGEDGAPGWYVTGRREGKAAFELFCRF